MKLSRFTDLGLRALMMLGADRRRHSAREISEFYGVSKDHMIKGLQRLEHVGIVESTPGRGGGFSLSVDPRELRVGDIVRNLEPSLALAECFEPSNTRCPLTGTCLLSKALAEGLTAFLDGLNQYTLADLAAAEGTSLVQIVDNRRAG